MLILTGSRQLNKVDQWRLMNYGCLVVSLAPRIGVISNDLRRIQPGAASAQEGRWINTTPRVYISESISLQLASIKCFANSIVAITPCAYHGDWIFERQH